MTFVVTDEQRGVRELHGSADAARHVAAVSLCDGPVGRVGIEIEAHCIDLSTPQRRPSWERIQQVIAGLPELPGRSRVTVEPGGAVELSGPPLPGALPAITAMAADQAVLRAAFAEAGLGLLLLGADPLRPVGRVNPGARYAAMEAFFAASGTPDAGAAMMTATASVQVNLDAGPREGWAGRVRLAHALGPVMVAVSANSPMLSGHFTGWVSSRQQVWGRLDSARCGPVLGASGEDPGDDWARYALKAPVMLVHAPDARPVLDWVPFADWADGRVLQGGRRPTTADLDYHLTTLFPPVRPRGWLEIRYLDAVPDRLWPAVVFMLTTLLDHPEAAAVASEAVGPVATAWDTAARLGLGDRRLHDAAVTCVEAAAALAPTELEESMNELVDLVRQARSPGDRFADTVVRRGIGPTVTALAQGSP
jgi:glutamate--cysteine ligase